MVNWYLYNKKADFKNIANRYNINSLTARILCNRDIDENDIEKMLTEDISCLNNESDIPFLDEASNFIIQKIKENKNIRIIGDYDIDGVCSTYILYDAFLKLGAKVSYHLPDRVKDGYGINESIIKNAINDKIDLIVTCDNGVSAISEISFAKNNGIDVIVTDHHEVLEVPKDAIYVVNPKRSDVKNNLKFRDICGSVVTFKLVKKMFEIYNNTYNTNFNYLNYLEFATIATIGDVMPLVDENHILVKKGLKVLKNTNNIGLYKLLEISNLLKYDISVYHVGFILGPMINASGRLESAEIALSLFISKDLDKVEILANKLKLLNEERKLATNNGVDVAISECEKKYLNDKILIIYLPLVHESVAGIVAGRIKEKYNKPTIIITKTDEEGILKASCRSITTYNIFEELAKHKNYFIKFGGHALAAGFSIYENKIDDLRKVLNEESMLTDLDFIEKLYIDCELPPYLFSLDIVEDINKILPFGNVFKEPIFACKDVLFNVDNVYGENKNVIKLSLCKDDNKVKAVLFCDYKEFIDKVKDNKKMNIAYTVGISEYMGNKNVLIKIKDYYC